MKTKIDWLKFDTAEEIIALGKYITETWTGFTASEAIKVAELGYLRGWNCYGDYVDYLFHGGQQLTGFEKAMQRADTLESLGYDAMQRYEDGICEVLKCIDSLKFNQGPESDFDENFKPLLKEAKALFGQTLTKARPIGWSKKRGPIDVIEGATQQQYDMFEGTRTISGTSPKFIDAIAIDNIKYCLDEHGYKPHKMLLEALYTHGVMTRRVYNQHRFGAAVMSIDLDQPYVHAGATVKLPLFAPLAALMERAAMKDDSVKKILRRIEWLPQTNPDFGLSSTLSL